MNKPYIKFFAIGLFAVVTFMSCKNQKPNLPDLPYLKTDSTLTFKAGERFIVVSSTNSCCQSFWLNNDNEQSDTPLSDLIKLIDLIEDEADSDCAGCSSYVYRIYECILPGTDSLCYVSLPVSDYENLHSDSLTADVNTTLSAHTNTFRFVIQK